MPSANDPLRSVDLMLDVTEAAAIGEPAHIAVTVTFPRTQDVAPTPIVCFAKPGGGFSRGYFTIDLPGPAAGAQAAWHAERGWVFVSVDHLCVGESSTHSMDLTGYAVGARAAHAAEQQVLSRLRDGTLAKGFPALEAPVVIGVGQSMGGCLTIVQQAHQRTYDGIAVLGYGITRGRVPLPSGGEVPIDWRSREDPTVLLKQAAGGSGGAFLDSGWAFFYDDVDRDAVRHGDTTTAWSSTTYPGSVMTCIVPGVVYSEAASVDVPVLLAMGERDVVGDPIGDLRSFHSSNSVDLYVCPRMAHMHNFAGTRELMWRRLETWASWVREQRPC